MLAREGSKITLSGSYQKPVNSLAGLMGSAVQLNYSQKVEYVGELKGQVFIGYYKNTEGTPATTLLDMVEKKTAMYFSDDLSELHVMEQYTSRSPTFYSLKPVV